MTDKNAPELKPCPFCGGKAERVDIEDGDNAGGSFICCTVCQASGNIEFEFKENFIAAWNTRAIATNFAALEARAIAAEEMVKRLVATIKLAFEYQEEFRRAAAIVAKQEKSE